MKDEIKEILNQLEIVARKHVVEVCEDGSKIETMPASVVNELRLNNYSAKLLLDYITNLQQIEQDHQKLNGELREENKKLQEEIDRLNNIIEELEKYIGQEWYCFDNESIEFKVARDVLDKLKELKEE